MVSMQYLRTQGVAGQVTDQILLLMSEVVVIREDEVRVLLDGSSPQISSSIMAEVKNGSVGPHIPHLGIADFGNIE